MTLTMRPATRFTGSFRFLVGPILTVVLASCSPNYDPIDSESADPIPAASIELVVTAFEFGYDTTAWAVPVGETITITLTNNGTIAHEWAVLKAGVHIDQQAEFREDMVLFEVEALKEGESDTQTFSLPQSGRYEIICAIQGHLDAGMRGEITATN